MEENGSLSKSPLGLQGSGEKGKIVQDDISIIASQMISVNTERDLNLGHNSSYTKPLEMMRHSRRRRGIMDTINGECASPLMIKKKLGTQQSYLYSSAADIPNPKPKTPVESSRFRPANLADPFFTNKASSIGETLVEKTEKEKSGKDQEKSEESSLKFKKEN